MRPSTSFRSDDTSLRARRPVAVAAILAACGFIGCNAIFGLDDLVVDEPGPTGGTGGSSATTTTSSTAGGGGTAGAGGGCAAPGDCSVASECLDPTCVAGACGSAPKPSGTACTEAGGKVCDGQGACVECVTGADCPSGVCQASTCRVTSCGDGEQNGLETDVDCGGADCGPCSPGKSCAAASDCLSGVCTGQTCQAPTCVDGVKNGAETDVDCGTQCPPCADGLDCILDSDCQSLVCGAGACAAPTCSDGVENGTESDVDCGGSCAGCALGEACVVGSDCASGLCTGGLCVQINGCGPATAVDLTGQAAVTIMFGSGGNVYTPKCSKVTVGTAVTFSGNFSGHPLVGGEIVGNTKVPDPTSPFMPITSSGNSKTFTLSQAGDYPFYCDPHGLLGMNGAVFVVP